MSNFEGEVALVVSNLDIKVRAEKYIELIGNCKKIFQRTWSSQKLLMVIKPVKRST